MARRKVTYEIDEELVRDLKIRAAREAKPEYVVIEEALRAHLPGNVFRQLAARVRNPLDEDEAMRIAVRETRAVRAARAKRPQS